MEELSKSAVSVRVANNVTLGLSSARPSARAINYAINENIESCASIGNDEGQVELGRETKSRVKPEASSIRGAANKFKDCDGVRSKRSSASNTAEAVQQTPEKGLRVSASMVLDKASGGKLPDAGC
jgi:hypothetical protein